MVHRVSRTKHMRGSRGSVWGRTNTKVVASKSAKRLAPSTVGDTWNRWKNTQLSFPTTPQKKLKGRYYRKDKGAQNQEVTSFEF